MLWAAEIDASRIVVPGQGFTLEANDLVISFA